MAERRLARRHLLAWHRHTRLVAASADARRRRLLAAYWGAWRMLRVREAERDRSPRMKGRTPMVAGAGGWGRRGEGGWARWRIVACEVIRRQDASAELVLDETR